MVFFFTNTTFYELISNRNTNVNITNLKVFKSYTFHKDFKMQIDSYQNC